MKSIAAIIIGAGQCGLAMSWHLSALGIEHAILERGEVANAWRKDRWDSLHLLTPNWQSRLPGYAYSGSDPDGYMSMLETANYLAGYAELIRAPVEDRTTVEHVTITSEGFVIRTDRGDWTSKGLVLATGACNRAAIPRFASGLHPDIRSISPLDYKRPGDIAPGGVLIVGASATGVQLARELQQSGRQVYLATGEHVRAPRVYRDRDIKWWMDVTGLLDAGLADVDDVRRARNVPSLQLIGSPERATLNLNELQDIGVTITGRLMELSGTRLQLSGSLANVCALADLKMTRLLQGIDEWIEARHLTGRLEASWRPAPTRLPERPILDLDLRKAGIETVLWATGYRPDYSWLHLPVFTSRGELRHQGGIADLPGLYVLGLPFLRKRKSSLIDGAGDDARDLSLHLQAYLNASTSKAA